MALLGSLLVKINGDNSGLDKSVDGSEKTVKSFSKIAIASYAAVGVAVVALSKKYVKAFGVQEKAETALKAAIKATGKESKISVSRMKEYASSLQEVTLFGDEAILSGQALLQSLADLNEKGLKEITPNILDFAQATGMNLEAAMSLVGKTLGSSTNALARYGIEIDTSGTKSEKLAQLSEVLQSKFGGAAEAAGDMASGDLTQLGNAFGDVEESLGGLITDGINPFVQGLIPIVSGLASWITKQREVNALIKDAKDGVLDNDTSIETMTASIKELNKQLESAKITGIGQKEIEADIKLLEQQRSFKQMQIAMEGRYGKSIADRAEQERIAAEKAAAILEARREKELEDIEIRSEYWNDFWASRTAEIDVFNKALEDRDAREEASAQKEIELQRLRLEASAMFFNGWSSLAELGAEKSLGLAIAFKTLAAGEAFVNSWLAYTKVLASGIPFPFNKIAASGVVASGLAAQAKIISTPVMLADGGVLAPATGGVPAVMAEAGVPEMAMPLRSNATDPFADKIAQRINNTTNNNTQNFNSMFSLNDDHQMREAARRLFPYMTNEQQRRGM